MEQVALISQILKTKKQIVKPNGNIALWEKWYKGKDSSFHNFTIYNGEKTTRMTRYSMHMAKKSCEDWASLLMNEKVSIGVASQDLLEKLLILVDFYNKTNKSVEYGFALSLAGLTVEINNLEFDIETNEKDEVVDAIVKVTDRTYIDLGCYSAKKTVPITIENNEIVECAFIQENTDTTKVTAHTRNEQGGYDITIAIVSNESSNIIESYKFSVEKQLFAVVHPQLVNNLDLDSQLPISVFGNAIDTLKAIDIVFDSYANEVNLGRKRIFVSSDMDKVDKDTGNIQKYFDPSDVIIHALPPSVSADGSSKPIIQEINGELRIDKLSQAMQDLLNYYSSQVGLGVDYYRFEKGRVQTATQVISEKSDTFRNLKKHEGVFEKALHIIITGLMYAHNEFTLSQEKFQNIDDVTIHFDDSIIEDKATEKTNDLKDVEAGAMSLVAYRMKWFAENEEEAKTEVKKIYGDVDLIKRLEHFTPFLTQGSMTPLEFVKNVYIDVASEAEQNALAEEIKERLKTGGDVFPEEELGSFYKPPVNEEQK